MIMGNARIAVICLGILLLSAAHVRGQDTLTAARDLYASAEYDSALKLLDRLSGTSSEDQQSIELYRSLCLLAVGRTQDRRDAQVHEIDVAPRSARRRSASCHRSCSSSTPTRRARSTGRSSNRQHPDSGESWMR